MMHTIATVYRLYSEGIMTQILPWRSIRKHRKNASMQANEASDKRSSRHIR